MAQSIKVTKEKKDDTADDKIITLISRDDKRFQLPKSAAVLAGFIKDSLAIDDEDDEPEIYEPVHVLRVNGDCLQKVVDFLSHYENDPLPEIRKPLNGNSFNEVSAVCEIIRVFSQTPPAFKSVSNALLHTHADRDERVVSNVCRKHGKKHALSGFVSCKLHDH